MNEDEYLHIHANYRGPSSGERKRPKGSSKAKGRGKKNSGKSGKSSRKGKGKGKRKGKRPNYGQIRKSLKQKDLSRGFATSGKANYSEAEDKRLFAVTQCFRCTKTGHISRNCPNAPAGEGAKTSSVGFSQEFFFTDTTREGTGCELYSFGRCITKCRGSFSNSCSNSY